MKGKRERRWCKPHEVFVPFLSFALLRVSSHLNKRTYLKEYESQ
jgi:hypothetical protein